MKCLGLSIPFVVGAVLSISAYVYQPYRASEPPRAELPIPPDPNPRPVPVTEDPGVPPPVVEPEPLPPEPEPPVAKPAEPVIVTIQQGERVWQGEVKRVEP